MPSLCIWKNRTEPHYHTQLSCTLHLWYTIYLVAELPNKQDIRNLSAIWVWHTDTFFPLSVILFSGIISACLPLLLGVAHSKPFYLQQWLQCKGTDLTSVSYPASKNTDQSSRGALCSSKFLLPTRSTLFFTNIQLEAWSTEFRIF